MVMAWNHNLTYTNFVDYDSACDDIEAAITERAKAMDNASLYASIPARNNLQPTRKNNSWAEWAYDSIVVLRSSGFGGNVFINYTDSSGDWDNQGGRAPLWTDAALLAKIGDSSIIDPSFGDPILSLYHWGSFVEQSYKILNELIWLRSSAGTTSPGGRKQERASVGDSYATAETAFNALSFGGSGAVATSSSEWDNGDHYLIIRVFNSITNEADTNSDLLTYDFDTYIVIKNDTSPDSTYSDPDYNTTEGNYAKTFSGSASTQKAVGTVGDINNSTQPDPEPLGSNKRYKWFIDPAAAYIISKYDVSGGFVYV